MILTTILPADAQPVAKRIPKKIAIHGYKWVDNYFWLREKSNPEVIQFLEAENKFTAEVMKSTTSLQEKLYTEMLAGSNKLMTRLPTGMATICTTLAPKRVSNIQSIADDMTAKPPRRDHS